MMHGEDHRRRGARLTEPVAGVGDLTKAHALTAEFDRHQEAQQAVFVKRCDRGGGKTRFGIDGIGFGGGDLGDSFDPRFQISRGSREVERIVARLSVATFHT